MNELLATIEILISIFIILELNFYFRKFHLNSKHKFFNLILFLPIFSIFYSLTHYTEGTISAIFQFVSITSIILYFLGTFLLWRNYR